MPNGTVPAPPKAYYDFFKTSGAPAVSMPEGPSMTRQEFKDEADINVLMQRYERTGVPPPLADVVPQYIDFTELPGDLMSHIQLFDDAQAAFMQLPAAVRKEFENNAHYFVEFAADPANLEQMRAWGLAPPAKPQASSVVAPVESPATTPAEASTASPGPSKA